MSSFLTEFPYRLLVTALSFVIVMGAARLVGWRVALIVEPINSEAPTGEER